VPPLNVSPNKFRIGDWVIDSILVFYLYAVTENLNKHHEKPNTNGNVRISLQLAQPITINTERP